MKKKNKLKDKNLHVNTSLLIFIWVLLVNGLLLFCLLHTVKLFILRTIPVNFDSYNTQLCLQILVTQPFEWLKFQPSSSYRPIQICFLKISTTTTKLHILGRFIDKYSSVLALTICQFGIVHLSYLEMFTKMKSEWQTM